MKFVQLITYTIGDKSVSFNGREAFTINDAYFKENLLAVGVFTEQENGDLFYSGKISVPMKDGSERHVDPRGFLPADKVDLNPDSRADFR